MKKLTVIGTALMDVLVDSPSVLIEKKCNLSEICTQPGGSMRNVASFCSDLGLPVLFISKFSHDEQGIRLISELQGKGCDVQGPAVSKPTPVFIHIQDPQKEYRIGSISSDFFFHKDQDIVPYCLIRDSEWGITDQKDPAFLKHLFSKTEGTRWIYSGSVPENSLLKKIEGLVVNREEIDQTSIPQLIRQGLSWIIVTQDKEGALLYTAKQTLSFPAWSEGKDRIGSGDAFLSGLACGLMQGFSVINSLSLAIQQADRYIQHK